MDPLVERGEELAALESVVAAARQLPPPPGAPGPFRLSEQGALCHLWRFAIARRTT